MSPFRTLLTPTKYLRAKSEEKLWWDWYIPALLAALACLASYHLPEPIRLLGDRGLVDWVNELLQVLVGFYIAALAAISSFDRESLDQKIEGDGVTLKVTRMGEVGIRKLTRRGFLSLLFGYLSLLSMSLYCAGVAINLLDENVRRLDDSILLVLRPALSFGYLFFVAQMVCLTLVALFYLSDRLHRITPQPLPPEDR